MHVGVLETPLIFHFPCVWILRVHAYGWLYSQFALHRLPLLIVVIIKFISKVITQVVSQDQPGSRNTVHKSIWHSRALFLFRTFHMSAVCRKKAPISTSLSLAYPSTLECLTDLGKYFNLLVSEFVRNILSQLAIFSARFGPYAIRSGSRRQRDLRGYSLNWGNNPYMFGQKIIDCGDVGSNTLLEASQNDSGHE